MKVRVFYKGKEIDTVTATSIDDAVCLFTTNLLYEELETVVCDKDKLYTFLRTTANLQQCDSCPIGRSELLDCYPDRCDVQLIEWFMREILIQ